MAKKAAKRIGRPEAPDPKVPVNCRVPRSVREKGQAHAAASQESWSDWITAAILSRCKRKPRK